jgi:hypothetical protein
MRIWIYSLILLVVGGCGVGIQAIIFINSAPTFSLGASVISVSAIVLGALLNRPVFR